MRNFVVGCLLSVLATTACKSAVAPDGAQVPDGAPPRRAQATDEPVPAQRLPVDVEPLAYELALKIVPAEPTFSGHVEIEVRLSKPRRVLWLHARDLRVTRAEVDVGGERLFALFQTRNEDGVSSLTLPRAIGPGVAKVKLAFEAPFNRADVGLYRTDASGDAYVFTQFQAIDARRAFPCFDEPGFKTPFRVTLEVKREHTAVANTRVSGEERAADGHKRLRFAPTEKLPTYLVAFAVGPLDVVEAPPIPPSALRAKPLPLRGVARRGKGPRLAKALSIAPALVLWLERYFGAAFPFDKLDLIAVPGMTGAMENAGAITFEEQTLLSSPDTYTARQARRIVGTLGHEIAHNWFGNLVTMRWWDDLWLNEAFATWMATRLHEAWKPSHQAWIRQWEFVDDAMRLDSLVTARRIRQPILSSHDINGAFDDITYGKGSRVLSMFERYLGDDAFAKGVQLHLQRFRFGSATADEFFESLSKASGKPVGPALRTFLDQPGVPLLEVRVSCEGGGAKAHLRQSRFLPRGSKGERRASWHVPACLRYPVGARIQETCALLTESEAEIPLVGSSCPAWLHANADGAGYYHFVASAQDLAALVGAADQLAPRERMALQQSLVSAFETGAHPAAFVLSQLEVLAGSVHRGVAHAGMGFFARIRDVVPASHVARFEAWARRLYAPAMARLGLEPRGDVEDEERLARGQVVEFLVRVAREPKVRTELMRRAVAWHAGLTATPQARASGRLDPALLEVALEAAVDNASDAFFGSLFDVLRKSTDAALRRRIVRALARATHPKRAERVRALALEPSTTANEVANLMQEHTAVQANRAPAFDWLRKNYDPLIARLPPGGPVTDLPRWFELACTREEAAMLRAFLGPRVAKVTGAPRNLDIAEERITLCAAVAEVQRESVRAFFEQVDVRTGLRRP